MTTQIIPGTRQLEGGRIPQAGANNSGKLAIPDKTYLSLPHIPIPGTKHAGYEPALELVARIDEDLTRGVRHYRNRARELLQTLDQVITAILGNDLLEPEG